MKLHISFVVAATSTTMDLLLSAVQDNTRERHCLNFEVSSRDFPENILSELQVQAFSHLSKTFPLSTCQTSKVGIQVLSMVGDSADYFRVVRDLHQVKKVLHRFCEAYDAEEYDYSGSTILHQFPITISQLFSLLRMLESATADELAELFSSSHLENLATLADSGVSVTYTEALSLLKNSSNTSKHRL